MKNSDTVRDIIDEKTAMFTVLSDEIREAAERIQSVLMAAIPLENGRV